VLNNSVPPKLEFEDKPLSDMVTISLWNEIFPNDKIVKMSDIKHRSSDIVERIGLHPSTESEFIQFVTAFSSSSMYGIQNPFKSKYAYNSMIKTLEAHTNPTIISKEWLIRNLHDVHPYLNRHRHIMAKTYADVCLHAKMSSTSMKNQPKYRDFILENRLDDLINMAMNVPDYCLYLGTRSDRRGKFRAICSNSGPIRAIDFLVNNGSYELCSHGNLLSYYTTEGYDNKRMWEELVVMSQRDGYSLVCLDFSGYDTQISLFEYYLISKELNRHRINDKKFKIIFEIFEDWLLQPKPLVVRNGDDREVVIDYYRTLASGLHGTHSFENLIGISTCRQSESIGINIKRFWTNGDDQNALVKNDNLNDYISFMEDHFDISWSKSLVGSSMGVWGKLWFTSVYHPAWEIGTFRSIWEREKGSNEFVEESKVLNNYCKIIQIAVTLIRLELTESRVRDWIDFLCDQEGVNLKSYLIPKRLQLLRQSSEKRLNRESDPKGLKSAKEDLLSRTYRFHHLGSNNYYEMLSSMYSNRKYFTLDVEEIEYYREGTKLSIMANYDYSVLRDDVPFVLSNIIPSRRDPDEIEFVRDVLQSTKSYDGSVAKTYFYHDMYTLARSINERNKDAWIRNIRH
jgi:hypothetical protein